MLLKTGLGKWEKHHWTTPRPRLELIEDPQKHRSPTIQVTAVEIDGRFFLGLDEDNVRICALGPLKSKLMIHILPIGSMVLVDMLTFGVYGW